MINPTFLAQTTRASGSLAEAKTRVLHSYRRWIRSAPEIQTMYSINIPVARIRNKMRQEYERHRYVGQMKTIDVLLAKSDMEFQETLNYWKQLSHVLKYFGAEGSPRSNPLPRDFLSGFMAGRN